MSFSLEIDKKEGILQDSIGLEIRDDGFLLKPLRLAIRTFSGTFNI